MESLDDNSRPSAGLDAHIGRRFREQRRAHQLSLLKAGEILGISQQQMSRLELGQSRVLASQLYTLSRAYNVPVTYFFEDFRESAEEIQRIRNVLGSSNISWDSLSPTEQEQSLTEALHDMPADVRTALGQLAYALLRHVNLARSRSKRNDGEP